MYEAGTSYVSRVYAVAQYAVLEASGEVNWIGEISHPSPPQPLDQFGCGFKCITTSPEEIDVQTLVKIDLAIAVLRMHEKCSFVSVFFVYISVYRSIYPFFTTPTGHILARF